MHRLYQCSWTCYLFSYIYLWCSLWNFAWQTPGCSIQSRYSSVWRDTFSRGRKWILRFCEALDDSGHFLKAKMVQGFAMALLHQRNVFCSLGASGSVWGMSDNNPRVVKSIRLMDRCSGLQEHLGAPGSTCDDPGSTDNMTGSTYKRRWQASEHRPQSWKWRRSAWEDMGAPGSAGDKPGSTSNHCTAVWKKHHLLWQRCWCAWKS